MCICNRIVSSQTLKMIHIFTKLICHTIQLQNHCALIGVIVLEAYDQCFLQDHCKVPYNPNPLSGHRTVPVLDLVTCPSRCARLYSNNRKSSRPGNRNNDNNIRFSSSIGAPFSASNKTSLGRRDSLRCVHFF